MADDLDTVVAESVEDAHASTPDPAPAADSGDSDASASPEPAPGFSDDDLKGFGLDIQGPLQPGQRENRIPYSRVRAIVESARKKLHRDWETERGKSSEVQRAMEARLQQMDAIGQIMQTDPGRFLQMLQQVNPAYAQFRAVQEAQAAAQENGDGRPAPDLDLGNGYRTYSPQGLQSLLDWQAQQLEGRLQSRYQPLEETYRHQQILAEAGQRVTTQLNDAMTWPLFEKHAPEILEVLKRDSAEARARGERSRLTLEAAYRQVVLPRLALDRDKLRSELLKEIQAAPTSTAAPAGGSAGAASAPGASRHLDDVIFDAIRVRPTR
jgi:hypothetical protein